MTNEQYDAAHPNPINSYGNTYGKHREFLEFDLDQHFELKKYCWVKMGEKLLKKNSPKFMLLINMLN